MYERPMMIRQPAVVSADVPDTALAKTAKRFGQTVADRVHMGGSRKADTLSSCTTGRTLMKARWFHRQPEPAQDKYVSRWHLDGVSGLIAVDDRADSIALVALCRGLALRRDV